MSSPPSEPKSLDDQYFGHPLRDFIECTRESLRLSVEEWNSIPNQIRLKILAFFAALGAN